MPSAQRACWPVSTSRHLETFEGCSLAKQQLSFRGDTCVPKVQPVSAMPAGLGARPTRPLPHLADPHHVQFPLQAGRRRIIMASRTLGDRAPFLGARVMAAHEEDRHHAAQEGDGLSCGRREPLPTPHAQGEAACWIGKSLGLGVRVQSSPLGSTCYYLCKFNLYEPQFPLQ